MQHEVSFCRGQDYSSELRGTGLNLDYGGKARQDLYIGIRLCQELQFDWHLLWLSIDGEAKSC
jgi:hypothetical protein